MMMAIHGFPWGNVFFVFLPQIPDLLGQKNEIKEKLYAVSVWSIPGYLKETKATESPPFIVKHA